MDKRMFIIPYYWTKQKLNAYEEANWCCTKDTVKGCDSVHTMPISRNMFRQHRSAYSAYNAYIKLLVQHRKEDEATSKKHEAEKKKKKNDSSVKSWCSKEAERSRTANRWGKL